MGQDLLTLPPLDETGQSDDPPPETEGGTAALPERTSLRRGANGLVIRVTTGDRISTGAARAASGIGAKLDYEELVFPDNSPPSTIGRTADLRDRAAIVLPASDHGTPTRATFADRACRIAIATRHPVLLVPASAPWPVRRCLAATDFGRPSLAAARAALELLEAPADLVLAFVNARDHGGEASPDQAPRHVRLLLDALPHTLDAPAGVQVGAILLPGQVLPAILAFAGSWSADLLSIGRHGRSTSSGLLAAPVGPTVRGLLEGSPCSVLIASDC